MKDSKSEVIHIRVSKEFKDRLKKHAKLNQRSITNYVAHVLDKEMAKEGKLDTNLNPILGKED